MRPLLRKALGLCAAFRGRALEAVPERPIERAPSRQPRVLLPAAPGQMIDRTEIFRRLRELELGDPICGEPLPQQEQIAAAALAAIGDAAAQGRYFPRRPNLLPQLMHAINDEGVPQRELAAIIARDPSLVGSLLKIANSAFFRVNSQPVETIERAIVMLGNDGLRSLIAAAVMQPIFRVSSAGAFPRFPDIVWEHAMRSAHAAIPHAALVERVDPFAAELLSLISGLAEIVLFRAAMDHYADISRHGQPDSQVIACLLHSRSAAVAWRLGSSWELSELMLAALEEQMLASEPGTPLGRSLRFSRCAGALAVLHTNCVVDDATVRRSLPDSGLSRAHFDFMLIRLLRKHEDPRTAGRVAS